MSAARLIEVLRILLVVAIGVVLANVTWFFVAGPQVPLADTGPRAPAGPSGPRLPPASGDQVAAANLFGVVDAAPAPVTNVDAPETRLRLELQGVFQSDHEDLSGAIVAEQNRPGELYGIGDRLPGNAVLQSVFADRILLRRGGVLETLRFPEVAALPGSGAVGASGSGDEPLSLRERLRQRLERARAAAREREGADDADDDPQLDPADGAEAGVNPAAGRSPRGVQQFIEAYGERLGEDPEGTLAEMGITPATGGGYAMGDIASNPWLAQSGLRPGDVILSVNGLPVGDVQADAARMAEIMASGSARIEVQRGDRRFFVTAPLR